MEAMNGGGSHAEDRKLAARIVAGDEAAEDELHNLLVQRLRATATVFLGWQDPDIEDIVQMTFIAAFAQMAGYDADRASLYTWMNRICVHNCFRRIRTRKRVVLSLQEELVAHAGPDRAEAGEEEERLSALRRQMQQMPEPCRGLVQQRIVQDRSYIALAAAFRIPIGTVASRLARCLKTLRDRMHEEFP